MNAIVHTTTKSSATVDVEALDGKVKDMYRRVATAPEGEFHFEMGRRLAERLGYPPVLLDCIPQQAIESFAGVGYHFALAALERGESVLDLGSGSGTDSFLAGVQVGSAGRVDGIDMTDAQREKALRLRTEHAGFGHVSFHAARIERLPFPDASFDCVISNGVINLVADKQRVFDEAARVLKPGGRLALSDIVTARNLPESVVCDATLWASCIGGAMHREDYQDAIAAAGLVIEAVQPNPQYRFLGSAGRAADNFGVCSVSLVARKR
jgi:SAM-dependent methyltransferase